MILILEIAFLLGGAYALFTGKIPQFLFGGPRYEVRGIAARLLGLLLMTPLPVSFVAGFAMALFMVPDDVATYGTVVEVGMTLGVAILSLIIVYIVRKPVMTLDAEGKPVEAVTATEEDIARKVNGSLIYLILGGLGFGGFLLGPLAYWRCTQALKVIETQHVGEQYRGKAQTVRILGLVVGGFWLLVCGGAALFLVVSPLLAQ